MKDYSNDKKEEILRLEENRDDNPTQFLANTKKKNKVSNLLNSEGNKVFLLKRKRENPSTSESFSDSVMSKKLQSWDNSNLYDTNIINKTSTYYSEMMDVDQEYNNQDQTTYISNSVQNEQIQSLLNNYEATIIHQNGESFILLRNPMNEDQFKKELSNIGFDASEYKEELIYEDDKSHRDSVADSDLDAKSIDYTDEESIEHSDNDDEGDYNNNRFKSHYANKINKMRKNLDEYYKNGIED